jgi:DNA-binding CsgD family transcriptional regulator
MGASSRADPDAVLDARAGVDLRGRADPDAVLDGRAGVELRDGRAVALETRLRQALHALDHLGDRGPAVVLLTRGGRVRYATRGAVGLLRDFFGPRGDGGALPAPLGSWLARERAALAQAAGPPPTGPPLVREGPAGRLAATLVPGATRDEDALLLDLCGPPVSGAALARLGLSRREVEVLGWVTCGKTNREIAELLFVSPRTVQKHLEHVFAKLGVSRRAAAAARALEVSRLPPDRPGRAEADAASRTPPA